MQKKYLLPIAILAGAAASASAQAALDPAAAVVMEQTAMQAAASRAGEYRSLPASGVAESRIYIVTLAEGADTSLLAANGFNVIDNIADMALVPLDGEGLARLAALPGIKAISLGYDNSAHLNEARVATGVDAAHAGEGLDKAYTGKGVVVGLMDNGIDINHLAFADADGKPRAKKMWVITGSNSAVDSLVTETEITGFTTDRSSSTHGTHVLGIMAGNYEGKGKQATINPRTGRLMTTSTQTIPYRGVAYEGTLAPCCGTFEFNNTTVAAGLISRYAESIGQPAVMNMSLGHNWGPHDGTSDACRYLAEYGKKMIICLSAGNEGADPLSIIKTFASGDTSVKTRISNTSTASCLIDIWGGDATPFTVTLLGVDKTSGAVKYSYKFDKTLTLTGNYYTNPAYAHDANFDPIFGENGNVIATLGVSQNNNRYNAYMSFDLKVGTGNKSGDIVPAILVEGTAGKSVSIYGPDGLYSGSLPGFTAGNSEGSISDLACGENVIVVGAYVNRNTFATFDGIRESNYQPGDIAYFSSYGTLPDGRKLPDIAGPGLGMISAYSNFYMNANAGAERSTTVQIAQDGLNRTSWWAEMSGTSMSSPFVAGVVALWLQADPTLTVAEVKDIMKATAINDQYTAAAPHRFGYGKIDALAGLKKILGLGSVNGITADSQILVNTVAPGNYDIFAPGAKSLTAQLYSLSGALAGSAHTAGENLTLAAESAAPGVYLLRVTTDSGATETRKVVIR